MSAHNICFGRENKKIIFQYALLSRGLDNENMKMELIKLGANSSTITPASTKPPLPTTAIPLFKSCGEGCRNFNAHCYLVVKEEKPWDLCEKNSYLIKKQQQMQIASLLVSYLVIVPGYLELWIGKAGRYTEGMIVYQRSKQPVPKKILEGG